MAEDPQVLDKIDSEINRTNKVEERIRDLSEKVRLTSAERDELAKAKQAEADARVKAEKERDFYSGFSDSVSKYPHAQAFKEEIKAKVMAGYTPEDATVSVLASKGKLTSEPVEREQVAGGSATITPPSKERKPISEMTREEKRQALMEAEKAGEIGWK